MLNKKLTKREKEHMQRAEYMSRMAGVIRIATILGFGSPMGIMAIYKQKHSDVEYDEIYNFWNYRKTDLSMLANLENILESLKSE